MRLTHVETLLALAECGSIRAAAKKLGKSQPVLTKRLQQMEDEVGLQLFQRTSRGIVPTQNALSILARARSVDAELTRLEQEVADLRGHQTGNIRLSVTPLVAIKIMPRAIARFNAIYPDIGITISSDLHNGAMNALREGQTDIIIGPNADAKDANDVQTEELFETEIALITSKRAAHATATSLEELTDCYWINLWNTTEGPGQRFVDLFERYNLSQPKIRVSTESQLGIIAMVKALDAVATFPVRLLKELGQTSDIVRIPVHQPIKPVSISMVTRAGRSLTPAGEALADCIRHRVGVVVREWENEGRDLQP